MHSPSGLKINNAAMLTIRPTINTHDLRMEESLLVFFWAEVKDFSKGVSMNLVAIK